MSFRSVLGAGLVALLAAAILFPSSALADQRYSDPAGDSSGALDLTGVTVTNDNAGTVTFNVPFPGVASLPADEVVYLVIDTDQNAKTGDKNGEEVVIAVDASGYDYGRWDGTTMNYDTKSTTTTLRYANSTLSIGINKRELNKSSALAFWIYSDKYDAEDKIIAEDSGPDGSGVWSYSLVARAVKLQLAKPTGRPALPVAGSRYSVSTAVTQAPASTAVTGARVQCVVRVAGKLVPARGVFVRGTARCDITVPGKTTGKVLRGTIAVSLGTSTSKTSFALKVL